MFAKDTLLVAHKLKAVTEKRMTLESFMYSFAFVLFDSDTSAAIQARPACNRQRARVGKGEAVLATYNYDSLKVRPFQLCKGDITEPITFCRQCQYRLVSEKN